MDTEKDEWLIAPRAKRGRGNDPGSSTHGESDEEAGPFIGIMRVMVDTRCVQSHRKNEKHNAKPDGGGSGHDPEQNGDAGGDEGYAGEADQELVSRHPSRDEVGEVAEIFEVLVTVDRKREREDNDAEAAQKCVGDWTLHAGMIGAKEGGEREGSSRERERFESAGAFLTAEDDVACMRQVQKHDARKIERADDQRRPAPELRRDETDSGGEQEDAHRVRASGAAGRPRRDGRSASEVVSVEQILEGEERDACGEEPTAELE